MNTTGIGNHGETAACKYLLDKGYKIIERNYNCKIAEIDIVAYDSNDVVCFVEVKTRKSSQFGYAFEAITNEKINQLKKGALCYIKAHRIKCEVRFDVIEVYGNLLGGEFVVDSINHIENAF